MPVSRAALAAGVAATLAAALSLPAAAQDSELCGVLTADDLSAAIPGSYAAPSGFPGSCQWGGVTDSGSGVVVIAYTAPGSAGDMPGAEVIDIGGRVAFSMVDPAMTMPTQVVGVETATGQLFIMTVASDDAAIDLAAAASALVEAAVERYESGAGASAAPAASVPEASAVAPAASAPTAVSDLCTRATPEEVAAAAGLDASLTLEELDGTCSYQSMSDDGYVFIYVARQDPAAFEAALPVVGAEEIDGPGEADWWASSLATLFSRTGDEVIQVSYASSAAPSDDEMRAASIAIMSALLAP
jgi:hypothetical protein